MSKTIATVLLVLSLGSALDAMADCLYGGRVHPTGTRLNGLTCQADGTWR